MDQRREPRLRADQPVTVTVLAEHRTQQSGTIRNASQRGLALEVPSPVPPGTPVQMEIEDALVLGEVVYCNQNHQSCLLGVQLDQMLCGLKALREKLQELALPESGPDPAPLADRRQLQP